MVAPREAAICAQDLGPDGLAGGGGGGAPLSGAGAAEGAVAGVVVVVAVAAEGGDAAAPPAVVLAVSVLLAGGGLLVLSVADVGDVVLLTGDGSGDFVVPRLSEPASGWKGYDMNFY